MDRSLTYRTLGRSRGADVVALRAFGGSLGDPVAAAITVDGDTRVRVVAPPGRATWSRQAEERFQAEVRVVALTHPALGRGGSVRVLVDPPQTGNDGGAEPVEPGGR